MTGSHYDRGTILRALDLIDEGTSAKDITLEIGATYNTVREWQRKRLNDPELSWLPVRPVVEGVRHGMGRSYRMGCRCAECRRFAATSSAASRRRRYLSMPPRMTSSVGSKRRVEALMAMGWPATEIAAAAGLTATAVQLVRHRGQITQEKRAAISTAYDALSMSPGPSNKTRGWARKYGYVPPLAWDDDTIDDPAAHPNLGTKVSGYSTRKLPEGDQLAAEVNGASVAVVADRYQVASRSVGKALRRAGYRAVVNGHEATYVREEAALTAQSGLAHLLTGIGWTPPTETPCRATDNLGNPWTDENSVKRYSPGTARRLCAPCPYADECLAAALEYEALPGVHRGGVWGGTTPEMRAEMVGEAA